jgi:hypothetical protein
MLHRVRHGHCFVPTKYARAARVAECMYFNDALVYTEPNVFCLPTPPQSNDISLVCSRKSHSKVIPATSGRTTKAAFTRP